MRTILTFDRSQTGFITSDFTLDFCKDMFTTPPADIITTGWALYELGNGMYVLDIPNATAGTIFSITNNIDPNIFTQGYFTDSIDVSNAIDTTLSADYIASAVWNSLIHDYDDVGGSFGKRIRSIAGDVIWSGEVVSATVNTITLLDTILVDDAYDPAQITILEDGDGVGQTRLILGYDGATRTAVVDRDWRNIPIAGSVAVITAHPGREHVNEGLARGGTSNTITLNSSASHHDNAYNGQIVCIRSGNGADQARRIDSYDALTKVATVTRDWEEIPDTTSGYVMLPTAALSYRCIQEAVYDVSDTEHILPGSKGAQFANTYEESRRARALAANKVRIVRDGNGDNAVDTITIYDDDNVTELFVLEVYGELANNRVKLYSKP